jgi:hypothetical protein
LKFEYKRSPGLLGYRGHESSCFRGAVFFRAVVHHFNRQFVEDAEIVKRLECKRHYDKPSFHIDRTGPGKLIALAR